MTTPIQAVFENGVFRPLAPLSLPEGQQVQVVIAVMEIANTEISSAPIERANDPTKTAEDLSEEEFEACLDSLAEGLDELPVLPVEAISREGICVDGDREADMR